MTTNQPGRRRSQPFFLVCLGMTLLGAALRIVTQAQSWTQIDEPSSLLAAKMVAEHGAPHFPSGVLYLQGTTISYLLAPLYRILEPAAFMNAAQAIMLVLSLAMVPIAMTLARQISGSIMAAAIAGLLVATDPTLMMWSVTIRPYGLLTVLTLATAHVVTRLVMDGPAARILGYRGVLWLPLLATIGTFTHVGYWLIWPGLAIVVVLVYRRSLFTTARPVALAGTLPLLAPVALLLLGRFVGIGSGTTGDDARDAFVGSHLFSLQRVLDDPVIRWSTWTANFALGPLHGSMPFLIALATGIAIAFALLAPDARRALGLLPSVAVHWSAIVIVGIVVVFDPQSRYLLHIVPLGYVVAGTAMQAVWAAVASRDRAVRGAVRAALCLLIVAPMLTMTVGGGIQRSRQHSYGYDTDYWSITAWVGEHHTDGEVVISALPPAAAFWFDEATPVYFLAGKEGGARARRYAKTLDDGTIGDYWLGAPVIGSTAALCQVLEAHAGNAWIIVDEGRLEASWAYGGEMADVMLGSSATRYRSRSRGTMALFVMPEDDWSRRATRLCLRAGLGL